MSCTESFLREISPIIGIWADNETIQIFARIGFDLCDFLCKIEKGDTKQQIRFLLLSETLDSNPKTKESIIKSILNDYNIDLNSVLKQNFGIPWNNLIIRELSMLPSNNFESELCLSHLPIYYIILKKDNSFNENEVLQRLPKNLKDICLKDITSFFQRIIVEYNENNKSLVIKTQSEQVVIKQNEDSISMVSQVLLSYIDKIEKSLDEGLKRRLETFSGNASKNILVRTFSAPLRNGYLNERLQFQNLLFRIIKRDPFDIVSNVDTLLHVSTIDIIFVYHVSLIIYGTSPLLFITKLYSVLKSNSILHPYFWNLLNYSFQYLVYKRCLRENGISFENEMLNLLLLLKSKVNDEYSSFQYANYCIIVSHYYFKSHNKKKASLYLSMSLPILYYYSNDSIVKNFFLKVSDILFECLPQQLRPFICWDFNSESKNRKIFLNRFVSNIVSEFSYFNNIPNLYLKTQGFLNVNSIDTKSNTVTQNLSEFFWITFISPITSKRLKNYRKCSKNVLSQTGKAMKIHDMEEKNKTICYNERFHFDIFVRCVPLIIQGLEMCINIEGLTHIQTKKIQLSDQLLRFRFYCKSQLPELIIRSLTFQYENLTMVKTVSPISFMFSHMDPSVDISIKNLPEMVNEGLPYDFYICIRNIGNCSIQFIDVFGENSNCFFIDGKPPTFSSISIRIIKDIEPETEIIIPIKYYPNSVYPQHWMTIYCESNGIGVKYPFQIKSSIIPNSNKYLFLYRNWSQNMFYSAEGVVSATIYNGINHFYLDDCGHVSLLSKQDSNPWDEYVSCFPLGYVVLNTLDNEYFFIKSTPCETLVHYDYPDTVIFDGSPVIVQIKLTLFNKGRLNYRITPPESDLMWVGQQSHVISNGTIEFHLLVLREGVYIIPDFDVTPIAQNNWSQNEVNEKSEDIVIKVRKATFIEEQK